jgi:hypothetical protein
MGLRNLYVAKAEVEPERYEEWQAAMELAKAAVDNRE